jgi:peptidoglycan/xylan/chitin deacetylase (PgdA/CDA1 family)
MRPKRDPVPRARDSWVWLGGVLLLGVLGAGVTAAAVLLWENIDIRQLAPELVAAEPPPLPEPPSAPALAGGSFAAVLFNSPRNREFFPDSVYYEGALEGWRELISGAGGSVRDAADERGLGTLTADELLVLPEAPCLSPAELAAIRSHLFAGGSIVANWAVGVRDDACEWKGWQATLELTGADDVRELESREALFLTVPAGLPLSPGFDPGTRIELRAEPSLALRLAGPKVYWSDWALNPAPDESGGGADAAAVATRTPEGGRTAWFGARLNQAATAGDSLRLGRLIQNGILWAAGQPMASLAPWPGAKRAALVFTLDVEAEAQNALDMAALLEAEGLPGSFYAVSQMVQEDAHLAAALSAAGEVGSQTTDHTPVAGLTPQDQTVRLRRSWTEIEQWTGVAPTGLRPPEESFDAATLRAWERAGGQYILAGNDARSGSPEIHAAGDGSIVVLPRLVKDDYNVVVQDGAIRAERLAEAFLQGTTKLRAIGGLAIVAGHTQIMDSGRRLNAYRTVADSARAEGDWWITRADSVATWWRARSSTDLTFVPTNVSAVRDGDVRMEPAGISDILVLAPPRGGLQDLWVDLVLPVVEEGLMPLVDGRSVDFATTDWGIRVPVGTLGAGETRRISLVIVAGDDGPPDN